MPLTVLYFAVHTTVILYYVPDCTVFCSPYHSDIILCPWLYCILHPYHSDIILCPWLYCILQSIPQWYYTIPDCIVFCHTTVILYYAPDCVFCSPYHSDIILCSLTVFCNPYHSDIILFPDCTVFCNPYHSDIILWPCCIVFCSPYHSDIILCPWLYCILQSIPQWYYTMSLTVLYFAIHTTVILYYAPDCTVFCSPYHSDIILCPWLYCILQSIPQWYYTMSLTVLYFAVHTTVILYYAPDCTVFCSPYHSDIILCPDCAVFCSPYHSDIILCPWLYCVLQSIPQWYYTMSLTVLYFAIHTTVILYYAPDCTVFCSPYHSDIILCPWLYCILQSIPQWYYTMSLTVLYFAVHTTVILYYAPTVLYFAVHTTVILYYASDCIVFCIPYHSDIILCPWLCCILQSIPQWYYTMPLTVLYFAVHTTVILYYARDCAVFCSPYHSDIILCLTVLYFAVHTTVILYYAPDCTVFCSPYHSDIICPCLCCILQSIAQWYYTMPLTVLYFAVHTTVILYYVPWLYCILQSIPQWYIILCSPLTVCILQSIPQWYYTMSLTVLYFASIPQWYYTMPCTVLYFTVPDCTVFCTVHRYYTVVCILPIPLYCILQSIPQWYYTMPLTVLYYALYFAVHTTVILYYAPDCAVPDCTLQSIPQWYYTMSLTDCCTVIRGIVYCSPYHSDIILCPWLYCILHCPYHSDIILCPWLYCILQSIPQWYYTDCMPLILSVLYFAVHSTVILYYAPDCAVFCSPYHSDIILCPWLYCILQSIPQWYYTMPPTVLYFAVHTTVILYYAPDCTVFCSPYHIDIILCPLVCCILQYIPQWHYTMPLTVLYFAVHTTVILYYAPDCTVFCSPYHSDIILCPWLYCILQSIPQWYYTMPPTVLYFAVHTTVILYYATDCIVFCSPYHSDIILCPWLYCILQSIPQWYYTMPPTVLYFAVHTTVILNYASDCIVFCSPYHSDIILCPWLYCILQSIPQWYYTMPLTVLCFAVHTTVILYYAL